jgi:hypothetical protein
MEAASIAHIKKELQHLPQAELIELCLRLAKYKKANKELAHYLLFEAQNEDKYIEQVKQDISERFENMPTNSLFFSTKYIRKTLRIANQYAQYSKLVQTEIELLLHFCEELKNCKSYWKNYQAIESIYQRQLDKIAKLLEKLHEDLRYDYEQILAKL